MKKKLVIVGVIVLVIAVIIAAVAIMPKPEEKQNADEAKSKLGTIESSEDLSGIVDKIYEGVDNDKMPGSLQTQEIDVTDAELVAFMTGLENGDDLEYLVVSEPMMSSQAYSLLIAKVKDGVDASKVAEEMCENVDIRKWLCVTAEQVYATNCDDVVFLVMTNKETADTIYNEFKEVAGKVGEMHTREEEEIELPADM